MKADNLLEDLRYGVNYDAGSSGCNCNESICRCTTITGAKIIDVDGVVPHVLSNIPKTKSTWFYYAIDRLCSIHKLWDKNKYSVDIVDGYYGQEVGGILLDEKTKKAFEQAVQKIKSTKTNDELVFAILEEEYGYILPCLKEAKFSIKKVFIPHVMFGQGDYYRKVSKEALDHYKQREITFPQAIVMQVGKNKYRLIDGYHRLAALIDRSEEIPVIVAKHGK